MCHIISFFVYTLVEGLLLYETERDDSLDTLNLTLTAGSPEFTNTGATGLWLVTVATDAAGTTATIPTGGTGYFILVTSEDSTPTTRYLTVKAPTNASQQYTNAATEIGYISTTAGTVTGTSIKLYGATFATA